MSQLHPAWREVIIPFLHDQRHLDQLWCSSKSFHQMILQRVPQVTALACPMNTPIRKKSFYPSYIKNMTGLRSLSIIIYPRLRSTWRDYPGIHESDILSDDIPLEIKHFDCDLSIISKYKDRGSEATIKNLFTIRLFKWLDRFSSLILGDTIRSTMTRVTNILDMNYSGELLEAMKYHYIRDINLVLLVVLMNSLSKQNVYIASLLEGITSITLTGAGKIISPDLIEIPRVKEGGGSVIINLSSLWEILPNLKSINGGISSIPSKVNSYRVIGNVADMDLRNSYQLQSLTIKWIALESNNLYLPPKLTYLSIDDYWDHEFTVEGWNKFKTALPAFPSTLINLHIHSNAEQCYWKAQDIAALPRGLRAFSCRNFELGSESLSDDIISLSLLPPQLRVFDVPARITRRDHLLALPTTLEYVLVEVDNPLQWQDVSQIFLHFSQLVSLNLQIKYHQDGGELFPPIVLPQTLRRLDIVVEVIKTVIIPLCMITWPEAMDHIGITGPETGKDIYVHIHQWHLPQRLEILYLNNVQVHSFPSQWPQGLRNYSSNIYYADLLPKDDNLCWPEQELREKGKYLPDSSLCQISICYHDVNSDINVTSKIVNAPHQPRVVRVMQ